MSQDKGCGLGINYRAFYLEMVSRVGQARTHLGRPLTYAEKILFSHCTNFSTQHLERGKATLRLCVDRVALQDATAQMVLLQFMQSRRKQVAVPTTIHCDHLIRAEHGAVLDLRSATADNEEVYNFLRSSARKFGLGFWRPGSGIIHQVMLENHAFPGGLMIGTDSHTPNAGGMGMMAIGVGGADAAETMAGLPWEVLHPSLIGVRLTGHLSGWISPKDLITLLCSLLSVKGGTNKIVEFFGSGVSELSTTGKATITNMGAELGATTSLFPFDEHAVQYLIATGRSELAEIATEFKDELMADSEVIAHPERYYDQIIEINLDDLTPYVVGPHSPDRGRMLATLKEEVLANGWPAKIKYCLIGSCTNSSYGDMWRAAEVAKQGLKAGLQLKVPLLIAPGSDTVVKTLERDGILDVFNSIGATVLTNACGPCIGQWKRADVNPDEVNTIVSSFNRNFPGRNDGNVSTLSFLTSPEVVIALAFAGRVDSDPISDGIVMEDGTTFRFVAPSRCELPETGFVSDRGGLELPADDPDSVEVSILPNSERLQLLQSFMAWHGSEFSDLPILVKTQGKTTTDHISPAGVWLRYRGHLDRISDNMLLGATNAFTGEVGKGSNPISGEQGQTFADIGRSLKAQSIPWVIVGDENYGEGSSREHAAMSPRYLGCVMVLARSFARIHETNLKKQGILPLTFVRSEDYDLLGPNDRISTIGLTAITPGKSVTIVIRNPGGHTHEIEMRHSLTAEQIEWFHAGSALNVL
ncbi:MAG: acnA [Candidatus Paceibacter sp.]|jgi:aconitate hydratase|nr:acnA [Candidatus Paceibacter sp.]